jgi:hypothetical protein
MAILAALATVMVSADPTADVTQVPVVVTVDASKLVKVRAAAEDFKTGVLTGKVYSPFPESVAGPLTMVPGAMPGPDTVVMPGATMLLIPCLGVAPLTVILVDPAV